MQKTIMMALLLACGAAQAADWVTLGKSADGQKEAFVDVSSIRVNGNIRRAWNKLVMAAHTQKGPAPNTNKWVSYIESQDFLDCMADSSSNELIYVHYEDGTTDPPAKVGVAPWQPVPPGSMLEDEMKFVCAWKPT